MTSADATITGVDFVYVYTKEYAKALDFFENTLGFRCARRYGQLPGAEFDVGNLTLAVIDAPAFDIEFAPSTHPIALHVDDFAAAKARLESRGVTFKHVLDSGVCHMGFFDDPDGNAFLLHQRYDEEDD